MRFFFGFLILLLFTFYQNTYAQKGENGTKKLHSSAKSIHKRKIIKFGIASYYANKFDGRKTADDEIYKNEKYTAACNQLPFNTWIKVTYLKNRKSVIVRINDRLNAHNKRLVDLSKSAARKLGILGRGIVKVKVEVLNNYAKK
ncbi:MAG TPA: septal ring lytic transglycosylase RlpA family protein [Hanamia sp.]|nr:septal ring lytic transglycosylase RlpA family protein [Hanamia sp.]